MLGPERSDILIEFPPSPLYNRDIPPFTFSHYTKAMASVRTSKQTTLQRILTRTINDLGMDATVAILHQPEGPLVPQVTKGFSDREVRAVLRTLSKGEGRRQEGHPWSAHRANGNHGMQLRMITPGSKNLLAMLLKDEKQVYGVLVAGKREGSPFTKREKSTLESVSQSITDQLRDAQLFDQSVILARPWVSQEPSSQTSGPEAGGGRTYTSPQVQERIAASLTEAEVPFDRGWVTLYDPLAAGLEVLGCVAGHKKELLPGQRLSLNESASGWAVRHRKPRIDQNLASTQGRFQDYQQLYRDRFRCTLVVPFFVRGRVAGTITLASKTAAQYESPESESRKLEPTATQLAQLFEEPALQLSIFGSSDAPAPPTPESTVPSPSEPAIRRQERQAALNEVSSFLATEIRDPMGYIRAQLEEVTGEGTLDFDIQTRVEAAMRDLIRMESLLNDILDFAKPLALDRRPCRVATLIDEALELIATDLKVNRIEVTKKFPSRVGQVRWDQEKIQHAFLSIFTNALEAMSPGGHLRITVSQQRGRQSHMIIRIHNDGAPIPEELGEKIFEPYFTTKRSGTGLGLAMVKKIVEEHQGHIAIHSSPKDGTLVTIKLPALRPRAPYRRPGRSSTRRPERRKAAS